MSFWDPSNELVLETAAYLDDRSFVRLAGTAWWYQDLLRDDLHKRAIADRPRHDGDVSSPKISAIEWAVDHGNPALHWPTYVCVTARDCAIADIVTPFVVKAVELGRMTTDEATRVLSNVIYHLSRLNTENVDKDSRHAFWCTEERPKATKLTELLLSEHGANPTELFQNRECTRLLWTSLSLPHIFELLIQRGADVNGCSNCCLILCYTIDQSNIALTKLVLEAGADPSIAVPWRRNPLLADVICQGKTTETFMLLEYSADANVTYDKGSGMGSTILCDAVETVGTLQMSISFEDQFRPIKKILESGADPNGNLNRHYSALDLALLSPRSDKECAAMVKILIEHGADVAKVDGRGYNLVERIAREGNERHTDRSGLGHFRTLVAVALELGLPSLLPGEHVLEGCEHTLEKVKNITKHKRRATQETASTIGSLSSYEA
ncbi:uncharacterized protein BDZ99DRAFT_479569 [Mytilinidion resinicola]|uniref:Ankyrin n=1 Tax=Mytilinidion resinicola TaxID=574789 RepID=A0A6A6YBW4_9PEZI|nr:uncharacterized protein BDZ99DRAFT_479569 [Mytilinidion resinicola]KAF2806302.1 hypothetical protein BDZ99DRAFT_479569 [Mytilinidion resinicola]